MTDRRALLAQGFPILLVAALMLASVLSSAAQEVAPPAAEPAPVAEEPPAAEEGVAPPPGIPPAVTNPAISPGELTLRLIPLTRDELAALAEEWLGIVRAKTEEIVDQQLLIAGTEGPVDAETRARLNELINERRVITQNFTIVIDSWERKNGDPDAIAALRAYRNAIIFEEARAADFRTLTGRAFAWIINPEGGLQLATRVAVILASLFALFTLARLVRGVARRWVAHVPNLSKLLQAFAVMVIYWITIAFGLMVVLSSLGIDITPLFALIGGASFILAFALQDTLGNLASGLMIMINRPFDEGDYVDIGGVAGTVKSVSIVSTVVSTPDNQVIVVPNSKVWGNVITNVTASETRRVDLTFDIAYEDSIKDAERVLWTVVEAHPLVLPEPEPVIRVSELGESSVKFICRPWVRSGDYWTVYWDLTRQVKEAFDAAGISIPFPQTDLHVRLPKDVAGKALPAPVAALASAAGPRGSDGGTGRPAGAPDIAGGDAVHDAQDEDEK